VREPEEAIQSIEWICDDVEKLKRDAKAKMSEKSLLYLKKKGKISAGDFNIYASASEIPEEGKPFTLFNKIIDVNEKLVYLFDTA
jgi:hypothetical protein